MKIIPRKPFTWVLIIVFIYGYTLFRKENPSVTAPDDLALSVKSKFEGTKFLERPMEAIVEKIRSTPEGKAAVDAYIKQSIKNKYGTEDASLISALEGHRIVTLDLKKGEGNALKCSSTAIVHYEGFVDDVIKFDSTVDRKSPITITIGDKQVIRGLENGILGMQKGGTRKIAIPPHLAYDDPDFKNDAIAKNKPVLFEVELLTVKNGIKPQKTMVISDKIKGEGSEEVFCKSKVNIQYSILHKNKKIYENSLVVTVGSKNSAIGLDKGLMGMKLGGIRKIIAPASMLKAKNNNILPKDFTVPENGKVTIEVELLAIG